MDFLYAPCAVTGMETLASPAGELETSKSVVSKSSVAAAVSTSASPFCTMMVFDPAAPAAPAGARGPAGPPDAELDDAGRERRSEPAERGAVHPNARVGRGEREVEGGSRLTRRVARREHVHLTPETEVAGRVLRRVDDRRGDAAAAVPVVRHLDGERRVLRRAVGHQDDVDDVGARADGGPRRGVELH